MRDTSCAENNQHLQKTRLAVAAGCYQLSKEKSTRPCDRILKTGDWLALEYAVPIPEQKAAFTALYRPEVKNLLARHCAFTRNHSSENSELLRQFQIYPESNSDPQGTIIERVIGCQALLTVECG